ncbi:MAG: GntR family transcriptional regulator [Pseudomonadota bacterium]
MSVITLGQRDAAYRHILDIILSGQISASQPISERQLALDHGFGRTPVREAIHALARDGLVEIVPARGTFIRQLDTEQIRELYEVRHVLEAKAVALAARNSNHAILSDARRNLEASRDQIETDISQVYEIGADFHVQMFRAANNSVLYETYIPIRNRFRLAMSLGKYYDRDWVIAGIEEHLAILDAVEAGDVALARRRMGSHLRRSYASKRRIIERLSASGEQQPASRANDSKRQFIRPADRKENKSHVSTESR